MLEFLTSYQSLDSALDLRDRLERDADPLDVPELIAQGIRAIRGWREERPEHLAIGLSDRLGDVLQQVAAIYRAVVIPRDYEHYWARAQEELRELIEWYTCDIEKLRAMPCATRRQRRKVREEHYRVSLCDAELSYQSTTDDAAAFARWKSRMEQALRDGIEGFRRTDQRLWDNRPGALTPGPTGVGSH